MISDVEYIEKSIDAAKMWPGPCPRTILTKKNLTTIARNLGYIDRQLLKTILEKRGYKITDGGYVYYYTYPSHRNYLSDKREVKQLVSIINRRAMRRQYSKGFWNNIDEEGFKVDSQGNATLITAP